MALPDGFQHTFYERGIPPEVALWVERIYQSPFSTCAYFRIFRRDPELNALVIATDASVAVHAFIYAISGTEVTLLNELVEIEPEFLRHFVDTVFDKYHDVKTIHFNCQYGGFPALGRPRRLWKTSQDIAIPLPGSFEQYKASLSAHTRKNLTYYSGKLHKKYPDFAFQVTAIGETDPSVVSRILEMNRLRMKSKHIRSGFDRALEGRIIEFCRHYGTTGTVTMQGRIVAGTICYELGNQAYMEIISHHPDFDKDRVGQVCLYLTIQRMIETGKGSFHMLWGDNEYKYRFLGIRRELFFGSVYRSGWSKLANAPKLVPHLLAYAGRQCEYLGKKYVLNRFRS